MGRQRHGAEQIIAKLREAEVELARGEPAGEVCRKLGVTEETYYRWRREYGGSASSGTYAIEALRLHRDFKRAWATACKKPGFHVGRKNGGFVFHNTRHTAVTNLVNADVPAHEAMTVSGHRTRSIFDRYSLTLKDQTQKALRQVSTYTEAQDTTPTIIPVHT